MVTVNLSDLKSERKLIKDIIAIIGNKDYSLAKDKLEENARRYIAIKNSIKRYEKDGSEYSLNHISKLEKRLETVKGEIRFWNDKLQIAKKK